VSTAVYLVGAMGTGKSTVMAAIMDQLGVVTGDWFKVWPSETRSEFRGENLEDIVTGELRGLYLGRMRDEYPGTDAIGLASHAEAYAWAREAPEMPALVLGEGARLGTVGFLRSLAARPDTQLVVGHLVVPEAVQLERLARRAKAGNAAFRKGTRTRAAQAVVDAPFPVVELDTSTESPEACAKKLLETTSLL
jgi:ribose 1,5-bisphosphokinase PhnN